jgi:FlaA1/EpsC-like NDP-sugar epimerase
VTSRQGAHRVLIIGAGAAGRSLADDVIAMGDTCVGFLDDFSSEPGVLGTLGELAEVVDRAKVDVVYIAIPSADAGIIRDLIAELRALNLEFAIIPRTYRVVSRERVSVSDLTDVDVLDVVGRAPIKHDMESARAQLHNKRVLVTGAAGSIGSRILTQLAALEPAAVMGVDRSESAMFFLGREIAGTPSISLKIADVQSEDRMRGIMREFKPDFVFHVAAYKHVPLMQENPVEAFNNNVWGSLNTLRAAVECGVEKFVYVSTDKAVNPTNVMGATKRIGELLLHDLAAESNSTSFSAVRFGNVLESEGSVMQIFRQQLNRGENLTVTHPDVTRFFMTIDEAAQLVIQSASLGKNSELFVLDMGEPIRVKDLAEGLIKAVNPSLKVEIVGLRPGEKMFEELSYVKSEVDTTTHPKIFVVNERDTHDLGETLRWVSSLLPKTRSFSISDASLKAEMRAFGFADIQ